MSPFKFLGIVLLVLLTLLLAAAGGATIYGRERLWEELAGPPDMGPYDFDVPTRTGKPNDSLACPAGRCLQATPERTTPLFAVPADKLYADVRARIAALPGATFVEEDAARGRFRAIVRVPLLHFPNTVSVQVREEGPQTASLWIYSRSQIGHADLGINDARVRRLVRDASRTLPKLEAGDPVGHPAEPAPAKTNPPAAGPS